MKRYFKKSCCCRCRSTDESADRNFYRSFSPHKNLLINFLVSIILSKDTDGWTEMPAPVLIPDRSYSIRLFFFCFYDKYLIYTAAQIIRAGWLECSLPAGIHRLSLFLYKWTP